MSNETKRDVFERTLEAWEELVHDVDLQGEEIHGGCEFDSVVFKYEKDYAAALPDDLPVIPENISEAIKALKYEDATLMDVYQAAAVKNLFTGLLSDWINENINTFAIAWLLGVWRVEETGEVVKLEEEK
jgi:hypothetical protein